MKEVKVRVVTALVGRSSTGLGDKLTRLAFGLQHTLGVRVLWIGYLGLGFTVFRVRVRVRVRVRIRVRVRVRVKA